MISEKDIICMFGDSITAGGLWIGEVFQTVASYGTKVFNCGVSGDTATDSFLRIETDCLNHNPTIAFVMFGVNDIEHWIDPKTPDLPNLTKDFIRKYRNGLIRIIDKFSENNVKTILITPPPYVEGSGFDTFDYQCNNRVKMCADCVLELSQKYNLDCLDINTIFSNCKDMEKYYYSDRVHPNEIGNRIIAREVLNKLGITYFSNEEENFNFSEKNMKRMSKDSFLRGIMFAKHNVIDRYCGGLENPITRAEQIDKLKRETIDENGMFYQYAKNYLENFDELDKIKEEVILLTEKMI